MLAKATARGLGQIAKQLLLPIAACAMLALCATSRAADKIGIVFMHGEAGRPRPCDRRPD